MRDLNKILIIRFSSLGDIILASPLIRVLREKYPMAQIDFLVKSDYADMVRFNPHLSSIIELKSEEKEELKNLKEIIHATKYDAIIDIHNSLRSRYLRLFSSAKYISVVDKQVVARFILVKFKWDFYNTTLTVVDRYFETIKRFGVKDDGKGLEVFVPEETKVTIKAMMDRYKLDRYDVIVGIAPFARHFTKRWLPERFIELGSKIARLYNAKIFIFGGKEEHDYCGDISHMINSHLNSSSAESFAGKLTILEMASALDACDIVISNDTGIMHLAAARKTKLVAIFGSTVREFGFFPYGTENTVIENHGLRCRPCSHIGLAECPEKHFRCMKDIQVDEVLAAAQQMLAPRQ